MLEAGKNQKVSEFIGYINRKPFGKGSRKKINKKLKEKGITGWIHTGDYLNPLISFDFYGEIKTSREMAYGASVHFDENFVNSFEDGEIVKIICQYNYTRGQIINLKIKKLSEKIDIEKELLDKFKKNNSLLKSI